MIFIFQIKFTKLELSKKSFVSSNSIIIFYLCQKKQHIMRQTYKIIYKMAIILSACFLLVDCAAKKNVASFSYNEPYNGNVIVIPNGQSVPEGYIMIGTISYGDTGFSTKCSLEYEIQDAIETAKENGASLIYIQSIKAPDFFSTCYRTTFALYKKLH
jgi:hypothetical protein